MRRKTNWLRLHRRTSRDSLERRHGIRIGDGPAISSDFLRPRKFLNERSGAQKLAVGAIQNVKKPVAIRMKQQLPHAAFPFRVDQHGRLLRIPIVKIVRRVLEMPHELT
jgi:hypothetical protein